MNQLADLAKLSVRTMYEMTNQIAARSALIDAINLWRQCLGFCDQTLEILRKAQELYQQPDLSEPFHDVLSYRNEVKRRFDDISNDLMWRDTPPPAGLFPPSAAKYFPPK